jgi:hypothetical protein
MSGVRGPKNLPVSVVEPAPGELRIVQDFVNTADLQANRDQGSGRQRFVASPVSMKPAQ